MLRYSELDPFKVNQLQIRHYLIAQKITIKALDSGQIIDFETERMRLIDGDRQGEKRPDVVWITSGMERYAIEIELSAKWDRNLDSFILGIARDLQSSKNKDDGISRYVIISDSRAIIDRYQQAMQPDQPLRIWGKNDRNHWVIENTIKVPAWLINLVDFQLIEY